MRKTALKDEILLKIENPARYIGGEVNSVMKDPEAVKIRFAMCFPDVYEIGMSHLGIQILYDMFNKRDDVWCERVYSPWPDLHKVMKEEKIPLFGLESQTPVKDMDFLGITIQYEMCYTNILQILDLSGMPFYAKDRGSEYPLVIGGGPCSYNPEPLAPFFDMFYIGEGEVSYDELFDLYNKHREKGDKYDKTAFLREAAKIKGIYVPMFYKDEYNEDGTMKSFTPIYDDIPARVEKTLVMDFDKVCYPDKPLVPFIKATQDRVVLEIQRGCIRGCRFCQAGMIYRPVREKNIETLKAQARAMLKSTGAEEISLSSLSSSDYSKLEELITFLIDEISGKGINISLPSLRIDAFSLDVMKKVQDVKKSSLTFAPEAGTQRLRNVINKGLTEDDILKGAALAFKGGWNKVKLYFMLGVPTETEEDMKGIAILADSIAREYYDLIPKSERVGKCQITVSTSFFIPKPFTPLQWASMFTKEDYLGRAHTVNTAVKEQLNRKSIRYNWHEADVSVLEGVLARGDRRVSEAIVKAYELGQIYDAWTDFYDNEKWMKAFELTGIDPDFYTLRERSRDELFPWDFIDCGVTKKFLLRQWDEAMSEKPSTNCRVKCQGCGAMKYGGGVCFENKNTV